MKSILVSSNLQFYGSIAATAAMAGAAAVYLAVVRPDQTDPFHCATDHLAPAHTALVIDATDAFTPDQARRLLDTAQSAARALPRHGRLTLLLIRPDSPWEPEEVLSICSPGRGSEVNEFTETPDVIDKEWRQAFLTPLREAAARLTSLPAGDESPILQSLSAIAGRRDFGRDAPDRTLIYVGDGLQHTAGIYSHYRASDPVAAYKASTLAGELDPDFNGATIEFDYMRRPVAAGVQGARHKAFWRWWFASHGEPKVTIRGG